MTCYQRHLGWLFDELALPYEATQRRRVDDALRVVLGIADEDHCPQVWAAIKALDEGQRAALAGRVAVVLGDAQG